MTHLSDYERQRLENIAANQAVLESLGLAGGAGVLLTDKRRTLATIRESETMMIMMTSSRRTLDVPAVYQLHPRLMWSYPTNSCCRKNAP